MSTRLTIPLTGDWDAADDAGDGRTPPTRFAGRTPVPGTLAHADPAFPNIGAFRHGRLSDFGRRVHGRYDGRPTPDHAEHERRWIWMRTTFRLPEARRHVWLELPQAHFGAEVFCNGRSMGMQHDPFSCRRYALAVDAHGVNELSIRLGAHPGMVPESVCAGSDTQKDAWHPGLPDGARLIASDGLLLPRAQVVPEPQAERIRVVWYPHGPGVNAQQSVRVQVCDADGTPVAEPLELERAQDCTCSVPAPRLWSPEDPYRYQLAITSAHDARIIPFGMRTFASDPASRRFHLNGAPRYLRGTNLCLWRFLEDPASGRLIWDADWARRLLQALKDRFHLEILRFHMCVPPHLWFDLCDELGLLVQCEYPIWIWLDGWDPQTVAQQQAAWVRDHANHPSIVIWDACNETVEAALREVVVPAARQADRSDRPWENGYNLPHRPRDVVTQHPYFLNQVKKGHDFHHRELMLQTGSKRPAAIPHPRAPGDFLLQPHPCAHTAFINEYGFGWVRPDGEPTNCTRGIYERLLPEADGDERLRFQAKILEIETGYWRAHRQWAGVMHFTMLSGNAPHQAACDHFRDHAALEWEPLAAAALQSAFMPLGVFINHTDDVLRAGARHLAVMLVNDHSHPVEGTLQLVLRTADGVTRVGTRATFDLPALGQHTLLLALDVPLPEATDAAHELLAIADAGLPEGPSHCRRQLRVVTGADDDNQPLERAAGDAFN